MSTGKSAAQAFGQRLRQAMHDRGATSDTSRSGVDVTALASAAGTSYEMARRYAEGQAMPRADTLARIASWLRMPAAALAYGAQLEDGRAPVLNTEVLQRCITALIDAQASTGITVPPARAARLVALLYQEATEGHTLGPSTVERMLRAIA